MSNKLLRKEDDGGFGWVTSFSGKRVRWAMPVTGGRFNYGAACGKSLDGATPGAKAGVAYCKHCKDRVNGSS